MLYEVITRPEGGDTWESIARRELPGEDESDAVAQLQSWNLHVFLRALRGVGRLRGDNPVLPSDVIRITSYNVCYTKLLRIATFGPDRFTHRR